MPPIDAVRKPKKKPPVTVVVHVHTTPDQADRERSPAQKARDRRTVNRTIAHAQARARVTPDQADRQRSPVQQARDRAAVAQSVASSREKALSKAGRGGGFRQVKRELEGRGVVAHALSSLAAKSGEQSTHPGSTTSKLSVVGLSDNILARGVKDVVNAPGQLLPSVYVPAAGIVEAIKSGGKDTSRLRQLGHDVSQHDTLYNLGAAGVNAAKGDTKAAGARLSKAGKTFNEHPGFAVLEAMGARGVLGRGAGGLVRTGAKATGSETLRKIGTTERDPKTLKGTQLVEHRRYSKDLFRKADQVIKDRQAARRAAEYRAKAKAEKNPQEKAKLKALARKHDPTRIDDKDIQRRADEHVAVTEDVRRTNQARTVSQENKTLKETTKTGPLASLVTQRIIRPTLKSMEKYHADLIKAGKDLKGSRLRANQQLVHDLGQAIEKIKSGELSVEQLKEVANRYGEHSAQSQELLTSRGIYDAKQSERRALTPFAIRELGAHRDPEYLTAQEKAARKTAKSANKTAARARGKTLQQRQAHTAAAKAAEENLKRHQDLPTPGWALKVLQEKAAREAKARETQIKRSTKRSEAKTKAARGASDVHGAAKALRKADPLLVKSEGGKRVLETSEMKAALAKIHGEDAKPGLVAQTPAHEAGGSDFYQGADKPKGGETRRLEGSATQGGLLDATPERMLRQHVRAQALADAHDSYTSFISQFARRKQGGKGKVRTYEDAGRARDDVNDLNAKGGVQWRVVRLSPFKSGEAQLRSLLEGAGEDPHAVEGQTFSKALTGEGDGPWAIIPEAAAKQMQQHMDILSPNNAARGLRSVSSGFRRSVLATSLPWMTGNIAEAGFRSAINRVGPGSFIRGHRIAKAIERLDPEGAQRAQARLYGGGHYAYADRRIHANLDAYTEGLVKDVTGNWRKLQQLPPAKQAAWLWDHWTHFAFNTVNKSIEQFFQKGMLGRAAKEQLAPDSFTGLRKTSQKAIDQMAEGVIDPNTAAALKSEIDRMYGKYQGFSPSEKFWITNYTPFGAWMRNAAVLLVRMAEDHPATTLTGTAAVNATEEWRKSQGLDIGSEGAMEGWLQGSIPLPGGAHLRATRFTPMALATDFPGNVADTVLPQFSSIMKAMQGKDWTGKDLKADDGGPPQIGDKVKAAVQNALQAMVPGVSTAQTVKKHGLIGLPESAVGYTAPAPAKGGGASMAVPSGRPKFGSGFKPRSYSSGGFKARSFK